MIESGDLGAMPIFGLTVPGDGYQQCTGGCPLSAQVARDVVSADPGKSNVQNRYVRAELRCRSDPLLSVLGCANDVSCLLERAVEMSVRRPGRNRRAGDHRTEVAEGTLE